jgi:hypothetical protein
MQSGKNTAFFPSIEMLDAFRYGKINQLSSDWIAETP